MWQTMLSVAGLKEANTDQMLAQEEERWQELTQGRKSMSQAHDEWKKLQQQRDITRKTKTSPENCTYEYSYIRGDVTATRRNGARSHRRNPTKCTHKYSYSYSHY